MAAVQYYGTGRRKTSTARVFLRPGTGAVTINRRPFEEFFPTEALRTQIKTPLVLTETGDKFDILATVARMSNLSAVSVTTSGVLICVRSDSVGKKDSNGRSLILTAPVPGRRNTRAVDVLRRPVP